MIAWLAAVALLAASTGAWAAEFSITADGASLTVRTQGLEARFSGPDLCFIANRLTGECYTHACEKLSRGLARIEIAGITGSVDPGEGRWTLTSPAGPAEFNASSAPDKTAQYTLRVSAEKGELVLHCEGLYDQGGVRGASWGINDLCLDETSAILPAKAGRILRAQCPAASEQFEYPSHWEAQFAVINGRRGSALVYSTDQQARFKHLSFSRAGSGYQLVFRTDNQAPFAELKRAESVEWRIACFDSDWRRAVAFYKAEMRRRPLALYTQPKAVREQTWAKKIRAVVRLSDYKNTRILDELARRVDPAKTLLYLFDWREDGYDVNYPDYTGRPGLAEYTRHAQKLGFRVMYHVDLPGVTPSHPAYERVKQYQLKDAVSLELVGWYWDKDLPQRFAFINPAAGEFRKIFVQAMRGVARDYGPDAIHLDVSGPMWNDGSGLIEGMNYSQGSMQLHRDLLAALPRLALGGESVNELTAPFEHFVQRWAWPCSLDPHPVCDYLFGDTTKSYGYLGMPNPDRSPAGFLEYAKPYESQGVLPTLVVDSLDDMRPEKPGAARCFRVMCAWQEHNLRPDWNRTWPPNLLFAFVGDNGATAMIERTGTGVQMLCNGRLVYERAEGVRRVRTSGHIVGHAGYAPGEAIGLNPQSTYWIEPGPPDLNAPHVSAIEGDAVIEESRLSSDMVAFRFAPSPGVLLDLVDEIGSGRTGTILQGKRGPLERGANFARTDATVGGVGKKAILAHPPWLAVPGSAAFGGQTFAEYSVRIPPASAGRCELIFGAGILDAARETDGVTFIVNLDGKEAFRRHVVKDMSWQSTSLDLSAWAGRAVEIELVTDPGPAGNTNWDHCVWGEPRVVLRRTGDSQAQIALAKRPLGIVAGEIACGDSGGSSINLQTRLLSGDVLDPSLRLTMPCALFAYYAQPQHVALPFDLLNANFWSATLSNGFHQPGSVWGSGRLERITIDGESQPAVNAHPPDHGKTVLTWLLRLPAEKTRLLFTAGIKPKAATEGVGFEVRINGIARWTQSGRAPGWWDGEVDLADQAGRVIALELVTDSAGNSVCDWATWVRPRIAAAD